MIPTVSLSSFTLKQLFPFFRNTDTGNYLPPDDPNITNFIVSNYDFEKQHNKGQFNLLNVKQCNEAPSNIQHARVKDRVYVRAKIKPVKAFQCEAYATKERKMCFQGSVKDRCVDRTVWDYNTLHLPVTLIPLESKIPIRHLNGTNNKILNNFMLQYYFNPFKRSILSRKTRTISNPFCTL